MMLDKQLINLEKIPKIFNTGNISDEEMKKKDVRKAITITVLSTISTIIVTLFAYMVNFTN